MDGEGPPPVPRGPQGSHGAQGQLVGGWWSPASTDVMSQLCRVCGEPAAGFHFGAFTCEGCKSFFGRTYNNLGSISECKNQGTCVINKKNRTSCKACRLRKCLLVGMSKSGSRYGRRSNWFKIHCLLQQQSQGQGPTTSPTSAFYPGAFLHSPFLGAPGHQSSLPDFGHQDVKEERSERSASSHSEYSSSGENDNDSSRSPNTSLRPSWSHQQTPSPLSEPELKRFESLRWPAAAPTLPPFASPRVLFPPPSVPAVTRPGLTPALMFLDPSCPPRAGGDLALASPALGGVAEDQDQPIDLSVKGTSLSARTSPHIKMEDEDPKDTKDVKEVKECVRVTTPLDLTSKRGAEAPQSG